MIAVVAAIVLTALAVGTAGALILASPLDRGGATRLGLVAAAWLVTIAILAASGLFARVVPAIGIAVIAPVVIGAFGALRVPALRTLALGTPLALLVVLHAGRLLGAFFLVLHTDGRLPATFARSAGWGDIAVAALSLPVAWMALRRVPHWRAITLSWNVIGFIDLVAAVAIGLGSAPGSPVRFIFEASAPNTMATRPWMLIPGFLVPVYLLAHLAVFARIAARDR